MAKKYDHSSNELALPEKKLQLNPNLKLKGHEQIAANLARSELWKRGDLSWLLDENQKGMKQQLLKALEINTKAVVLASRRLGKSHLLCVLALERALRVPHSRIQYLTTTNKAAKRIVLPLIKKLQHTAPAEYRAEYHVNDGCLYLANGSEIILHGCDHDPDALRGTSADLVIIDEASYINNLAELVSSVLSPLVIECDGKIIMSSTPCSDTEHDFIATFLPQAEASRALIKRTIYDSPRLTEKKLKQYQQEAGSDKSDIYRREYLCEIVRGASENMVIPEFTDTAIVDAFPQYPYPLDSYVGIDPGWSDNCGIVFCQYDFERSKVLVLGEDLLSGATTSEISEAITAGEKKHFPASISRIKRYSDTDARLVCDLRKLYNLKVTASLKDNKELAVNFLRTLVAEGRLEIHSSCVNLISQLRYGVWKTSKTTGKREFSRSKELGHLDLLDALIFCTRNINYNHNPIPTVKINHPFYGPQYNQNDKYQSLKNLFGGN